MTPVMVEPLLKYGPSAVWFLTRLFVRTLLGGQFDWGGRLQKGNGGFQRYPRAVW